MVKVRAALALLMLALFPFLVVALLIAIVAAALWAFRHSGVAGTKILLYVGLPLVVAVFVAVRDVLRARPELSAAPELKREEHPALWAEVERLADGLATPAPSRIVVTPEVNAGVREVRGQREMIIGLPLLVALTVPELRSVLGHELGHYGAGHTRLLRLTYRAKDALLGTVRNADGILRWVLVPYARMYLAVAAAANRAQEEEADDYSVRVAGPRVAADAMRMVAALDHAWHALTTEYLPLAGPAHRRPRVSEGLQELLVARAQQLEEVVTMSQAITTSSPGDSHPPLGQRVARFEALAAAAPQEARPAGDDEPAWQLLSRGWAAVEALEQELLRDGDPAADWPELVRLAGAEISAETAGHLARAAQATGAARPTLAGFLDAIEAGTGSRLVAPLVNPGVAPEDRDEASRQVLTEVLTAAVVDALVTAGKAEHRIDWAGGWRIVLLTPDGEEPLDAHALVGDAVADPALVPRLRERLTQLGVALEHATEVTEAADPDPVGLITRAKDTRAKDRKRKTVDILVCDTGLLVLTSGKRPALAGGLRQAVGAGNPALRQAEEVIAMPHADRTRLPGARWIDTDDIRAARLNRRPWGWTLRIHLQDGQEVVLRSTNETADHGPAYAGLGELFGARMNAPVS